MATNQRKREAKGKFPQSAGVNSPPLAGRSALPKENLRVLVSGFNEKQSITAVGVAVFLPAEVSAQAGKDGKVLLGKRKGSHGVGEYAFPGGKLEYLESFGECARREVREECGIEIKKQTISQIASEVCKLKGEFFILGPVIRGKKGEHKAILKRVEEGRYVRVRLDGTVMRIEEALATSLDAKKKHSVEIAIDRLRVEPDIDKARLADSIEQALKLGDGTTIVQTSHETKNPQRETQESAEGKVRDLVFSERFACAECNTNLPEIEPRLFSFNSPHGACVQCTGLGTRLEVDPDLVLPNP
ncbi:MAG: excinuclease ABC subunit A, partial [Parcubacteria group bacterium Gr01-1014_107]